MESQAKNDLDLVKFNQEFEQKDTVNKKYKIKPDKIQERRSPKFSQIDKIILAMRLVFELLLDRLSQGQNPLPEILEKDELIVGLIALCFFIGGITLILGGIMVN